MSGQESSFIKAWSWISGSLSISFIIGGILMFRTVGEQEIKIDNLKQVHINDVQLIRQSIDEIKLNQKTTQLDVQKILIKIQHVEDNQPKKQ